MGKTPLHPAPPAAAGGSLRGRDERRVPELPPSPHLPGSPCYRRGGLAGFPHPYQPPGQGVETPPAVAEDPPAPGHLLEGAAL